MTTSVATPLTHPLPRGRGTDFHLSDLLARHRDGDGTVFVTDDVLHHARAGDPLLYTAHRDVLPRRHACGTDWFTDLVDYQPGELPGGELHRSTGHWNTPRQLEIFQTLTGCTAMITAWRAATGEPVLTVQVCRPGALTVIPFGGWHLTVVLAGPATVFNVYADLPAAPPAWPVTAEIGDAGKYRRGRAVEITAVASTHGFTLTGTDEGRARWGAAQPIDEPAWLRDVLGHATLPDFCRTAEDTTLATLVERARWHVPVATRRVSTAGRR